MLQQKYRLKKRKQFNYIFKNGKSTGCDCLTLVYNFCRLPNIKVGFSASKKVGNSVMRHRALRKMREAVKVHIKRMQGNHNYIFIAKDTILQKSVADITKSCEYVLRKGGLLLNA
jgi:ribonuclease P protein component